MKDIRLIALFTVTMALIPVFIQSGAVLNFLMMGLYATLLAQAWNVLGGFGGQFSFGHALFFGTGAYVQAIAQLQLGVNAWCALLLAMAVGSAVGAFVGAVSFSYCGVVGTIYRRGRWFNATPAGGNCKHAI